MASTFTSKGMAMEEHGRIFVIGYNATNYPYGVVFQFQIEGTNITSSITNPINSQLTASNWQTGSDRYFRDILAVNNTLYFVTESGEWENDYRWYNYLCLSKVTSSGVVSTGSSFDGYTYDIWSNGTDVYWYASYDRSNSSGYKEDYYVYKFPNGNISSRQEMWKETVTSGTDVDVEYLGANYDKFLIWYEDEGSYWSTLMTNTGTEMSIDRNYIRDYWVGTDKYLVVELYGRPGGYSFIETGVGIALLDTDTAKIEFIDSYCANSLPYVRFDESANMFYFGTDDNYEFIYTIV